MARSPIQQLGVPAFWLGVAITMEVFAAFACFSAVAIVRRALVGARPSRRSD